MQLNSFIFPKPKVSYSSSHPNLVWVEKLINNPKQTSNNLHKSLSLHKLENYNSAPNIIFPNKINQYITLNKENHIPCLYYEFPKGSSLLLLFFHGNAEDIGDSWTFLVALSNLLQVNSLLIEYPGYGLYKGKCSATQILNDADTIMSFLIAKCKIKIENIIIVGRSIGSGPAIYLASKNFVTALIVISGCLSIKNAVKDYVGSWAGLIVKERFENWKNISKVKSPILIIHGLDDEIIPVKQALQLKMQCSEADIYLGKNMTHNKFYLWEDMGKPILNFFEKYSIARNKDQILKCFEFNKFEQNDINKQPKKKRNSFFSIFKKSDK